MRLTILDRYIARELISPFFFGILAFSFILAGSTVLFPLMGEASKYGMSKLHVFQLFVYKFPSIVVFTFPMSMLLASIMSFGRLNSDMEIIAFRAGGIKFSRLVLPVVVVGLMVSLVTIAFNEAIVPRAAQSAEELFRSYRHKTDPTIKRNINLTEYEKSLPKRIINVLEIDKGLLKNVTVAEFDEGQLTRVIRSESGRWLPAGGWEFYNGIMHFFTLDDQKKVTIIEFNKEYIDIKINPFDFAKREKSFEELTAKELWIQIKLKELTGQDTLSDIMHFHMKFSVPFASLIFAILGASVGLRPHRSSSAMGLGVSLVIILVYYVLLSVGMGMGLAGTLPPFFAAWLPNLVVGASGLYLLTKLAAE